MVVPAGTRPPMPRPTPTRPPARRPTLARPRVSRPSPYERVMGYVSSWMSGDTRGQAVRRGSSANRFLSLNKYLGSRSGRVQLRLRADYPGADPQDNLDYLFPIRLAPSAITAVTPQRRRERKAEIMRLMEPSWARLSTDQILSQPKATQKAILGQAKAQRKEFLELYVNMRPMNVIAKGVPFIFHEPFWIFGLGYELYALTRQLMGSVSTLTGYGIIKRIRKRKKEAAAEARSDELRKRRDQRSKVIDSFVREDPMRWVDLQKALKKNRERQELNAREQAALDSYQKLFQIPEEASNDGQPSFVHQEWDRAGGADVATDDDVRMVDETLDGIVKMAAVISREPVEGKFDRLDAIDRHFEDLMVYLGYAAEGPTRGARLESALGSRVSLKKQQSEDRQKIFSLIERYDLRKWFGDQGADPVADLRLAAAELLKESTEIRYDMDRTGKMLPQIVATNPVMAGAAAAVLAETNPRLRPCPFADISVAPGREPREAYVAQKIARDRLPKKVMAAQENGEPLRVIELVLGTEAARSDWPKWSRNMRELVMRRSRSSDRSDEKARARAGVAKILNKVELASKQMGVQPNWGPSYRDPNAAPDHRGPHYSHGVEDAGDESGAGDAAASRAATAEASARTARVPGQGSGQGLGHVGQTISFGSKGK